ncbi:SPOR domain-containing protein [Psychrobacter phenylpyruvicus]|uniref:D-gamma-glutamyl-meso-diaminopimelic acid endopeptidase CwlS n=1 Tax=Psychrobacter phenylpyruvicus TaxID=29432 RepID=A0A379LHS6_9GAMM|nr:SPOR domain-containing protein [Psychrobacter phenylpyruvicus]SUD90150.1 D-gamma-glutamyl-meso-diaminopimelic acid endopeptidase CwlS precursor [Psychrobacter phenylpyruvicus]
MGSSRQLLLGTGVFIGGGVLLLSLVKQMDAPKEADIDNAIKIEQVSTAVKTDQEPLTADIETEERLLAQKRLEREKKMAQLDQKTREFLTEQEKAEALAMQKARLENEQYRSGAAEPVVDEMPNSEETSKVVTPVTRPVVTARPVEQGVTPITSTQPMQARNEQAQATASKSEPKPRAEVVSSKASSSTQKHTVQRGEGLIKLSRQYNVPVEAISQANKLSKNSTIQVGQEITIPSQSQIDRLVRDYNASNNNQSKPQQTKAETTSNSAPTSQQKYQVKAGDGLIKLARQYNVPVEALAAANNMSTNTSLRVGQDITIPSRKQVQRLQREAEQKKAAEQNKREAQQRLAEARRKAASGEAKGTFGVQVALADNQQKADAIVKELRAAGYSASTSNTSRGVRVIVGPEKGKEAALALKDKINADPKTNVNNAWVLYWR